MNKKEVTEIKKNFSDDSSFLTMNRAVMTIINDEGEICAQNYFSPATMNYRESRIVWETLKKILTNKVGKNLTQYDFNITANQRCEVLSKLREFSFDFDTKVDDFVDPFIISYGIDQPYALLLGQFTYSVRRKTKNDEIDEFSEEEYNFVIGAICPVTINDSGFSFDYKTRQFSTAEDGRLYVSYDPTDGFIYPAFDNRSPNVNSIMCYSKKGEIAFDLVEDVFGLTAGLGYKEEKNAFKAILKALFEDELSYTVMYAINEKIADYVENTKDCTRLAMIAESDLEEILTAVGVDSETIEKLPAIYEALAGEYSFHAVNLLESKMKVESPGCTISVNTSKADLLGTTIVDGARSIKYKLDEPIIEVNDIAVKL